MKKRKNNVAILRNSDSIYITGNFDGGNPKSSEMILKKEKNFFRIEPFSEDNDPNYKFRLDIKILNNSDLTQMITLEINWKDSKFIHLRDHLYYRHEAATKWSCLQMSLCGKKVSGKIKVSPGETYVCQQPKYNYKDYIHFIRKIPASNFISKKKIGLTPGNKELWLIKIFGQKKIDKKKILLLGRIHPYETAASFCIEGIVEKFFNKQGSLFEDDIYIIPMANPDGVYEGLCKLSTVNGIDLSKKVDLNDAVSLMLKKCIDTIKPDLYCELHNWMLHGFDGIYYLNWYRFYKFISSMPSQKKYKKKWKAMLHRFIFIGKPVGFKKYCRDAFGSQILCLEFPWKNRSSLDMKKLGSDTLNALANCC